MFRQCSYTMEYLKNTAVYPAFPLENWRKLLIICEIRKINICIKKLFCRQENNRIHLKKLINITLPDTYCCELLEILCHCIFLLFYDGYLLQCHQLFNQLSWKRKRTCNQITKGTIKKSRDWFCMSCMFSWWKHIHLCKTFRGEISKQKWKKNQIKNSFKSCSYIQFANSKKFSIPKRKHLKTNNQSLKKNTILWN